MNTMRPRRRLILAALLSASIYALPLVGPHAVVFLGEALLHGITKAARPPTWTAAEIAVALVMQLAAGVIWYWILGRPVSLRPLGLVLAVPAFFAFAEWCFLLALPAHFLIEHDVRAEQRSWKVACRLPNESLVVVGYKPAVVRSGDTMLVSDPTTRLARVAVTDSPGGETSCAVAGLALPLPTANDAPAWVGDGGRALMVSTARQTGAQSWLWIAAPDAPPVRLEEPAGRRAADGGPVVSVDGRSVAWLTPVPNSGQPPVLAIVVRPLPASAPSSASAPASKPADVVIDLGRLGLASFVLRDVDTVTREVLLAMNERSFVSLSFDGTPHGPPLRPDGVHPLHMTFRRLGDGWVAWDGYKEDGYTIAWSLPAGSGRHHVPRGRAITDLAVQPDGRLIAVSVTTSLSIGEVRDAVYVLRAADGVEVFRHYLPRYARSVVLFPARDLFAYTDWDGSRATTVVLRVPRELLG